MKTYIFDDENGAGDEVTLTASVDWITPPDVIEMNHPASGGTIMFYLRDEDDE